MSGARPMLRPIIHIALHAIVPAAIARGAYRKRWRSAFVVMFVANLIDLDHLLANPMYDANRCSVGFHPLHSPIAIVVYVALLLVPKVRLFALGALIHVALDGIDCLCMAFC